MVSLRIYITGKYNLKQASAVNSRAVSAYFQKDYLILWLSYILILRFGNYKNWVYWLFIDFFIDGHLAEDKQLRTRSA